MCHSSPLPPPLGQPVTKWQESATNRSKNMRNHWKFWPNLPFTSKKVCHSHPHYPLTSPHPLWTQQTVNKLGYIHSQICNPPYPVCQSPTKLSISTPTPAKRTMNTTLAIILAGTWNLRTVNTSNHWKFGPKLPSISNILWFAHVPHPYPHPTLEVTSQTQ